MKEQSDEEDYFVCPHCGTELPAGSTFCRECGASDESGWNTDSDSESYGGYAPDDDFDYDEYLRREFPEHAGTAGAGHVRRWLLRVIVALVCLAFVLWLLTH